MIAIERATILAAELHQGTYRPAPVAIGFSDAAAGYITSLKTDGRSRKTIVKYEGVFKIFTAFLGGRRLSRLNQVTAGHFDAWRVERRAARSAKTVYTESIIVMQLFRWAHTRKLIAENPLHGIRLNKPRGEPKGGPTLVEVNRILAAADQPLRTWLAVLAFSGMRVGELRQLRREDVDFAAYWIRIQSRPGAETKTRTSRKIPIHPRLRAELARHPRSAGAWFFTAGRSAKHPAGGNWINPKRVNDQFQRLLRSLNLPTGRSSGFVIHSLRHFFETHLVNAGIHQRVIDTWLGHTADKSMASVYYRLGDEESQQMMLKVPFGTGEPAALAGEEVTA